MKKFWALLLITVVFIVSGCGSAGNGKTADGKITVAASFYPMAEFARAVGGSHAEVYTMIGDGIEPSRLGTFGTRFNAPCQGKSVCV